MKKILSLLGISFAFVLLTTLSANAAVVYDALPSVSPDTSYPSQPFQAQQTLEFGDLIHLGGTSRILNDVTVTMVTWAKFADYSTNPLYMNNSVSWTHPITLNVYSSSLGTNGVPNNLLGTVTQDITIPWRPAASEACGAGLQWMDSLGNCNNGYAFNATFDLSSLGVTLPDDIIVSVAYNTQSYGSVPMVVDGPYNSLNVAVPENQNVSIGRDDSTSEVFWNTITAAWYTDGGAAGVGIFRKDTNWAQYGTVAMRVSAITPKDQCKKDGWRTFTNPPFKNQGQCVSYFASQKVVPPAPTPLLTASGDITMSNPSQRIIFSAVDAGANSSSDTGTVEYWNYDYAGGPLHYTAPVQCAYVNTTTKESRFMFQIPAGWAGLTGIYVVSSVTDNGTTDTYGQAASWDEPTARALCESGGSFIPYTITVGNVLVQ